MPMASTSLFYYNPEFNKTDPYVTTFHFTLTGNGTTQVVTPVLLGAPILTTVGAIAAQSTIDNFLGTSSEFTIAQFSATSMAAQAFGGIINMSGQAVQAVAVEASYYVTNDAANVAQFGTGTYGVGVAALSGSAIQSALQVVCRNLPGSRPWSKSNHKPP